MISLLESVWHGILDVPYLAVALLVESINGWLMALGAAITAAIAILPGFPEVPTLNGDVLSGVAWFLPIAPMLGIFATFVAAWVVWMGVTTVLRWARAL